MLNTEFIVPFSSLGSLEATLICFGDSSLHCYVPECLEKKKRKIQVLTLIIAHLDVYC